MPIDIEINIEVLKSANSMEKEEAEQTIDQTKTVMIEGTGPIKITRKNKTITLNVTTEADLGDGPWDIALINEKGGTLADLGYDPKRKHFPPQEVPPEEDRGNSSTSSQSSKKESTS
jgi:hypothetical protein